MRRFLFRSAGGRRPVPRGLRGAAAALASAAFAVHAGCGRAGEAAGGGGAGSASAMTNRVVVTTQGVTVHEKKSGTWSPELSDAERTTLFAIAADTLKWCVEGRRDRFAFAGYELTEKLKIDRATFVTLKKHGDLRGCIGSLEPVEALYLSVHHNAVNAALRDWRFSPVRPSELPEIEVHVSVLSPITDIASYREFKVGQQGVIIEKQGHRAVYLPEVAVEQKWTMEQTLSSLSQKAGMDRNAWKEGATFKVFESVALSK